WLGACWVWDAVVVELLIGAAALVGLAVVALPQAATTSAASAAAPADAARARCRVVNMWIAPFSVGGGVVSR
ncbi:MAG: hypothetical protein JO169_09310, partial [Solirubrobacterales bacterium]|nr:hypothetical protein [Solirubrobacterales bacterium]